MPRLTTRLKLSLPLSNEYVQREVLVKAFEEIDKLVMLQGDLDELKRAVNKYTDESIKTLKDETENKVGKPNGIAGLDKEGKVPTTQLPKREAKDVNLADAKGYYGEKTVESALQQVGADLAETDKKSQLLQHGLNVLNTPIASPLNVEIQGRTLVNLLGQTNLDNTKYYVFIPHKGTTKITYGGKTYEEVVKFTGQATVSYTIKQDFRGKVSGSTVENGHRASVHTSGKSGLITPTEAVTEGIQSSIDLLKGLDDKLWKHAVNTNNYISQQLFSFDIIRTLQDKFGPQIWQGKTTLTDKITIAKQVITGIACNWHGFGTSPIGNKATIKRWLGDTDGWFGSTNHTNSTVAKLVQLLTKTEINAGKAIDSNGFSYFLVHAEPSNGTVASLINTDYVELELEVNTNLPLLEDALYEVDQATYNKINVDPEYSGQKLLDKFPYVQGMQHLNPVVVSEGYNLLPPFTEWQTIHKNNTILSPYKIEVNPDGNYQACRHRVSIIPGLKYTLQRDTKEGVMYASFYNEKNEMIFGGLLNPNEKVKTFVAPINSIYVLVSWDNGPNATTRMSLENPMLYLGDVLKPFEPRNPSYLYTNTVLAGQNGVNDVLYQDDGQWKVLRKWERDVVLDGSTISTGSVSPVSSKEGFKEFSLNKLAPNQPIKTNQFIIKPNGMVNVKIRAGIDGGADSFYVEPANNNLYYRVPNEESGFTEVYLPTADEIKAYFNGWKVKTADANGKPIAWKSVVDGSDAPTQTLAYVRANRAPNYTPYKLTYQFATPRVENVQVEGDLTVSGTTQVTIDSGIVVREKVKPKKNGSNQWVINDNGVNYIETRFINRVDKIINIYKNGVINNQSWTIFSDASAYGKTRAYALEKDFDSTAEYTVTYLVLDKHLFTTNPIDVKATFNQSLKTSVAELVERQADVATGLSILANATSENTKDIVGLKKAITDNTTDITDLKNKMNTTSTKVDKLIETLSRYRSNKDDNGIYRTLEWKTKSGVLRKKAVITVSPTTGDYDKQIVTEYANDGTTITSTDEYKLILDGDGDIVNEVLQ